MIDRLGHIALEQDVVEPVGLFQGVIDALLRIDVERHAGGAEGEVEVEQDDVVLVKLRQAPGHVMGEG